MSGGRNQIGVSTGGYSALGTLGGRELSAETRARLVAAHRARTPAPRPARPAPTMPAPSRDDCPWCGIPGFKGCDHYLPCAPVEAPPPPVAAGGPRRHGPSMRARLAFSAKGAHARGLLAEIERFLRVHDIKPGALGQCALNDSGFVFALRSGERAPHASTEAKVRAFMAAFEPAPTVPTSPLGEAGA